MQKRRYLIKYTVTAKSGKTNENSLAVNTFLNKRETLHKLKEDLNIKFPKCTTEIIMCNEIFAIKEKSNPFWSSK